MGKYKLWLHHQEIGRRLRDQINTLELERGRVQKMTPDQSAPLPEIDNPIIAALRAFTESGHQLSNIDVIKAAMPKLDGGPEQRQPAPSVATAATSSAAPAAPAAGGSAVVASLLARAEQIPSDPLEQMRRMAVSGDRSQSAAPGASAAGASAQGSSADSVQGWWQNRQQDDDE